MSRADVEKKFRGNVGKRWSSGQTDAVLAVLWELDRMDDLAAFLGKLSVQSKRIIWWWPPCGSQLDLVNRLPQMCRKREKWLLKSADEDASGSSVVTLTFNT